MSEMEKKSIPIPKISKKVTAVFYLDKKYYKKKKLNIKKAGDSFTFEGGCYVLDSRHIVQIGKKSYIFYDLNTALPIPLTIPQDENRNAKVLDVLVSKRTLKALFGNPDKWYIILAFLGLGIGVSAVSVVAFLFAIGKLVIR